MGTGAPFDTIHILRDPLIIIVGPEMGGGKQNSHAKKSADFRCWQHWREQQVPESIRKHVLAEQHSTQSKLLLLYYGFVRIGTSFAAK